MPIAVLKVLTSSSNSSVTIIGSGRFVFNKSSKNIPSDQVDSPMMRFISYPGGNGFGDIHLGNKVVFLKSDSKKTEAWLIVENDEIFGGTIDLRVNMINGSNDPTELTTIDSLGNEMTRKILHNNEKETFKLDMHL